LIPQSFTRTKTAKLYLLRRKHQGAIEYVGKSSVKAEVVVLHTADNALAKDDIPLHA
jgi:hypothetical protein